jgi:hypothetical protein
MTKYIIEKHERGYLVIGPLPLCDMQAIARLCSDKGVMDGGVAAHHNATLAIGEPDNMEAWRNEIEDRVKDFTPPENRFLSGTNCGMSSLTICAALTDDDKLRYKAEHLFGSDFRPNHPHDADDFSRCHYLLTLRADWVLRLGEVAEKYPGTKWNKLAPVWQELTALHEAKKFNELSERIRDLVK